MAKLQHNFTTPEQSKRLLEIGLPKDSADLISVESADGRVFAIRCLEGVTHNNVMGMRYNEYLEWKKYDYQEEYYIPCWSTGRLMEIFDLCFDGDSNYDEWPRTNEMVETSGSVAEYLVGTYGRAFKVGKFDFSKLENEKNESK